MRIQNNVQSPNFGALIITPEARNSIRRCKDVEVLKKLIQAKKDMAKTEFFDIIVGQGLKCKLVSLKEAFFGVFKSDKYSNIKNGVNENILSMGEYNISRHSIHQNDEEYGYSVWKTKELCNIDNAKSIDTLTEIAKELDNQAIKHEKRTLLQNTENQLAKKLQQELLNKMQ